MSSAQDQMNALCREVDILTQELQQKIQQQAYGDLAQILSIRWDRIRKLVAIFSQNIDKEALQKYLVTLYQHDQNIIERVDKERAEIENSLLRINKIIRYSNPATRGGI